ncbi:dethiobiotin synthetase [Ectothiorhodospira magna]|uniref:ATP-dependent dethiobiotin synthetase BioD n=1 Tax=Ectothiorhodospira magna TaxID=867345 RepID=A0A1H9EY75_9GAMM|nr:dethiobiotin synthase [Ectothiorhodospira magna]SEQ30569.1 dethiobiotin synthetase [Ectothiorhodospira magna]
MTVGVFVTGTDTGVGKTVVGCALVRALIRQGQRMTVRKPAESGCEERNGRLWPADGAALMAAAGGDLEQITPYRYRDALAPDRAARLTGQPLYLADLIQVCVSAVPPTDLLWVEGAGGFYSPLTEDGLNADLAQSLGLPVLLVAPDRLGVINHVLLTAEAIQRRRLTLALVVLNHCVDPAPIGMDNAADIARRLSVPVMGFPAIQDGTADDRADQIATMLSTVLGRGGRMVG